MPIHLIPLEQTLLETSAGRAVLDTIAQSNRRLSSVPPATVDRLLHAEIQRRVQFADLCGVEDLDR